MAITLAAQAPTSSVIVRTIGKTIRKTAHQFGGFFFTCNLKTVSLVTFNNRHLCHYLTIKTTRRNTMQNFQNFVGGNRDLYHGQGKIWEIATRFNKESREINGNVTCVRRSKATNYKPVGVL